VPIARNTPDPRYGAAPDYSWVRGQLQMTQGRDNATCWILVYDLEGSDQYGGQINLIGNMPDIIKVGDFVQVRGQFDTSMGPAKPPCDAAPYRFTSIEPIGSPQPGSAATPASPSVTAMPQPTQDLTQPPGKPTEEASFGHADDYSWLRGYLKFGAFAACNAIIYGSEEKDSYGGKMILYDADLSGFQDGDFVTVYGQLDPGFRDPPPCDGITQGYAVKRIERQPGDPGADDQSPYGHAPDYSWLRGQITVTQIQGGCTFLVYDPTGGDEYGGRVVPLGEIGEVTHGEFVIVTGQFTDEPGPICPGKYYKVVTVQRQ
jgi:hypothetical protein